MLWFTIIQFVFLANTQLWKYYRFYYFALKQKVSELLVVKTMEASAWFCYDLDIKTKSF